MDELRKSIIHVYVGLSISSPMLSSTRGFTPKAPIGGVMPLSPQLKNWQCSSSSAQRKAGAEPEDAKRELALSEDTVVESWMLQPMAKYDGPNPATLRGHVPYKGPVPLVATSYEPWRCPGTSHGAPAGDDHRYKRQRW